jgi:hypothetical protein
MAALLTELEHDNPNVRAVMLNALRNVQPSHLLDPAVRRVPERLRTPKASDPEEAAKGAAAEPAATLPEPPEPTAQAPTAVRRLPVIDAAGAFALPSDP